MFSILKASMILKVSLILDDIYERITTVNFTNTHFNLFLASYRWSDLCHPKGEIFLQENLVKIVRE